VNISHKAGLSRAVRLRGEIEAGQWEGGDGYSLYLSSVPIIVDFDCAGTMRASAVGSIPEEITKYDALLM
jgi:hypothetical protein